MNLIPLNHKFQLSVFPQVIRSAVSRLRAVSPPSQNTIAGIAEQPPNLSRLVIVVDVEPFPHGSFQRGCLADSAKPVLLFHHSVEVLNSNSKILPVSLLASLFCVLRNSVVRSSLRIALLDVDWVLHFLHYPPLAGRFRLARRGVVLDVLFGVLGRLISLLIKTLHFATVRGMVVFVASLALAVATPVSFSVRFACVFIETIQRLGAAASSALLLSYNRVRRHVHSLIVKVLAGSIVDANDDRASFILA